MDFSTKIDSFLYALIDKGGYTRVLLGFKNTLLIAVLGLIIGIVIGTLIAVIKVVPKSSPVSRGLDKIGTVYVALFRGTPMVVQLLLGYFVLFPLLNIKVDSLTVCIIIFGLNSGAYVSEIMRSGILSVDPGQMEAGRALGLTYASTMLKIIVPQAVKNILPTLGNEFITLVKETSVVSFVGAVDLYNAFKYIGSANYEYMVPYICMAIIYMLVILIISAGVKLMEKRLRASDKR